MICIYLRCVDRKDVATLLVDLSKSSGLSYRGGDMQRDLTVLGGTFLRRGVMSEDKSVSEFTTASTSTGPVSSGPILELKVVCGGPGRAL